MPRQARYRLPSFPQYILNRGHNNTPVFLKRDNFMMFYSFMMDSAAQANCQVHAYTLLSNQVHLLVTPVEANGVSRFIQALGRYYGRYFNECSQRSGALWDGRYRASLIEPGTYTLAVQAHIERLAMSTKESRSSINPWSSYSAHVLGKSDRLLASHLGYLALAQAPSPRRQHYADLIARINLRRDAEIKQCLYHGLVFGSEEFKGWVAKQSGLRVHLGHPGRPRKYPPIQKAAPGIHPLLA